MARETGRQLVSNACLTWVIGFPLALAAIIGGGTALIWILERLPQN